MPKYARKRRLNRRQPPHKKSKYWDIATGAVNAATAAYQGYNRLGKIKDQFKRKKPNRPNKTPNKSTQTQSEYIQGSTRGECTISSVTHRLKPSKFSAVHKALANKFKYESLTVEQCLHVDDQNSPRQQEETAFSILNGTDYGAIVNTYYQNLPDTDPWQGKYPESGTMTGGKGHKVLIEGCRYELELQNATQGMVMLDIYTLVAKTTGVYEDPVTSTWTNAITSDAGTSLTTTGTRNFPGNKPTYYKQFRDTWKVLKKVTISMMGGSMHKQYSTCRIITTMPTNHYYNNALGAITYDEDVTTDHVYIPDPDGNGVIDTFDTANIA